jgi:hypothetical protein
MLVQSNELARREQGRVEIRSEALRLRWSFDNLVTADGHLLRVGFSCRVRALSAPAERQMLEEVFLSGGSVLRSEAVVEHFQSVLRSAAAGACQTKGAADWVGGSESLVDVIRAAADKIAFSCGLEFLPPFEIDLESPTLERGRLEAMQRNLAEQRAAGQLEHFQRAGELLKQFHAIRQSAPQLAPGEVLRQISPNDQGAMLQSLLLASAKEKTTEAVWAVAGSSLLRIDPRTSPPRTQLIALPTTLGPLRSVQPGPEGSLLIGARGGIIHVDPNRPAGAQCYADPAISSPLGFSRAVWRNDQVWACHGEAGVVAWQVGRPDSPALLLRPADLHGSVPKNLRVLDDARLLLSTRERLICIQLHGENLAAGAGVMPVDLPLRAEAVEILPAGERVFVVLSDGTVQVRDARTLAVMSEERRCGAVSAAAWLPWLGSGRLLLASEDGPVLCVGVDDDVVTQYVQSQGGLRALAAAADVIVGISADRQRVLWWNSWNPRQPVAEVFIPAVARHRVADVEV